jgi:hypothetical protein
VFTTKGDGTTYSIKGLAQIAEAGVESLPKENGNAAPPKYGLTKSITIAEGDRFEMESNLHVLFAKDVRLTIEGEADFSKAWSVYDVYDENEQTAASIRLKSKAATFIDKCVFRHLGVEVMGEGAVQLRACSFLKHNGSTAAALYFISAGAAATIEACIFEDCQKAAIGSAANASQPLTIVDCTFVRNSAANGNIPQINITAAKPLQVLGCTITGNPDNTMVGGLGISNFMSYDADISISRCTITDNRYGIGLVGPAASISITDNRLVNNRHEVNPMNGGSGISLYDPYQQTVARLTGNHIEGSLWGVTVIGCRHVNLGNLEEGPDCNPGRNVFRNNGFDGQLYDLYNNSTQTVYAQGNTWNVSQQTQELIETVIYHRHDNPSLGEVIYWPAATGTGIAPTICNKAEDHDCYDLSGRRVGQPTRRGLYIRNGKKVAY